jgi:diguanylate cyclase (GGDEF)-like protein
MSHTDIPNHIDKLTGLKNFGCFAKEFEEKAARAIEKCEDLTLAMVDIDHFLRVNDEFGHTIGDEVLQSIANHLRDCLPQECTLYRYSGDQFAVLFPATEKESAFLLLEKARDSYSVERKFKSFSITISLSVGISCCPEDGSRTTDIVRKAEGALYRAKAGGGSKVSLSREEKMVTKTSHYTYEQLQRLAQLAKKEGMGEAVLLREALDDLLKKYDY